MHSTQRHSDMCEWLRAHERWVRARTVATLALANVREARDVAPRAEYLMALAAWHGATAARELATRDLLDLDVKINNWDADHSDIGPVWYEVRRPDEPYGTYFSRHSDAQIQSDNRPGTVIIRHV